MTAALVIVCAPVSGLRVSSCCRCPWQPQCLGTLGHHSLERTLVSAPFQSVPLLPRPKKQNAPRSFRYRSENKNYRKGCVKPVSAPLVDARSPSCIVAESSLLTAGFSLYKLLSMQAETLP